jgi:hypothetical protein
LLLLWRPCKCVRVGKLERGFPTGGGLTATVQTSRPRSCCLLFGPDSMTRRSVMSSHEPSPYQLTASGHNWTVRKQ